MKELLLVCLILQLIEIKCRTVSSWSKATPVLRSKRADDRFTANANPDLPGEPCVDIDDVQFKALTDGQVALLSNEQKEVLLNCLEMGGVVEPEIHGNPNEYNIFFPNPTDALYYPFNNERVGLPFKTHDPPPEIETGGVVNCYSFLAGPFTHPQLRYGFYRDACDRIIVAETIANGPPVEESILFKPGPVDDDE